MSSRLNGAKAAPGAYEAMLAVEKYLAGCGLPPRLMHLMKLRASQINGCGYCVDMHSRDARQAGETERRVDVVAAFEESPVFTEREKAAFAWTESLTNVATTRAPDDAWDRVRAHFNERELADLTLLVAHINAWNRLCIGLRVPPPAEWPKLPPG